MSETKERVELSHIHGHQIESRYNDTDAEQTKFVLQALENGPDDLKQVQKHALSRNNEYWVKAVRRAKDGVSWKDVGEFKTLAAAQTAAKVRCLLQGHDDDSRTAIVTAASELLPKKTVAKKKK